MEQQEFEIEKIWNAEQSILDIVDKICKKYHIRYSLFFGTLIGAVRHKGFIPWDDDIDIAMPRDDYNRFVKIWNKVHPDGYILQDYHECYDLPNNFSKIRKDHTTFIQFPEEMNKSYHKGIFIDIFPIDRVAPSRLGKKIQYIACAVNLLYSRGYTSGSGGAIGTIEKVLLKMPKCTWKYWLNTSERIMTRWNKESNLLYMSPCTINSCKIYYPGSMFKKLQRLDFNGKKYLAVADTDSVLRCDYGDYMKLPPEEERVWKHHPILINFEKNYEEIS